MNNNKKTIWINSVVAEELYIVFFFSLSLGYLVLGVRKEEPYAYKKALLGDLGRQIYHLSFVY